MLALIALVAQAQILTPVKWKIKLDDKGGAPEKEIVLIISEEAKTKDIVESIRKETQIEEEGKGIIFITNVEATYGLAK